MGATVSVAYYIVLDNDDPGFETFVNGKAVAHALDELDALCDRNQLAKLDSFMGQSLDDLAEMLDEDLELPEDMGDAKWFLPAEGMSAIDGLIEAVRKNSSGITSAKEVIEDLVGYKEVLSKAQAIGAKWHLALDI